jgi:hypothetical protein
MPDAPAPEANDRRWHLLREVAVFQLKLALDAIRDVALSPLSLGAALLDLATGADREPLYFEQLLAVGRRSEGWIDLFGGPQAETRREGAGVDRIVGRIEALVVEQYEQGGMTAQAKAAIDRTLDALGTRRSAP